MNQRVKDIGNLLDDKHATDIEVFEVGSRHPMFDYVIVASVDINMKLNAIITEFKKHPELDIKNIDDNNEEWLLIDCYDILVHVFVKDSRQHYDIESILRNYAN